VSAIWYWPFWLQILKQLDADQSGSVSPEELQKGLEQMGEVISAEVLAQMILLLDRDGDGNLDVSVCVAAVGTGAHVASSVYWLTALDQSAIIHVATWMIGWLAQ
jgi:hypothetical protein